MRRLLRLSGVSIGALVFVLMMSFTASAAYELANPTRIPIKIERPLLQYVEWSSPAENTYIIGYTDLSTPFVVNALGVDQVGFSIETTDVFGTKYWKFIGYGTKKPSTGVFGAVYSLEKYYLYDIENLNYDKITIRAYGIKDGKILPHISDTRSFRLSYPIN